MTQLTTDDVEEHIHALLELPFSAPVHDFALCVPIDTFREAQRFINTFGDPGGNLATCHKHLSALYGRAQPKEGISDAD
jgi:hypothetical protein